LGWLLFFVGCAVEEFAVFGVSVALVTVELDIFTALALGAEAV
jgi:hypothetical protein